MIDHGMLNVPLAKRGNLNAQIDAHKAAIQRELRQRAAQDHADRKTARAAVVAMSDERCVELSKGTLTAKQARKKLLSMARFTPAAVLRVVGGAQLASTPAPTTPPLRASRTPAGTATCSTRPSAEAALNSRWPPTSCAPAVRPTPTPS